MDNNYIRLPEYVFQYAYLASFAAAIFFSIDTIYSIDLDTMMGNHTVVMMYSYYIIICSILALHRWFNQTYLFSFILGKLIHL